MNMTTHDGVMHFSTAPWYFFLALGVVVAWLAMVASFFTLLPRCDPSNYEAMGRPSFSSRGSFLRIVAYIYRRKHRQAGHKGFSLLCDVMCFWLPISFLLILGAAFGLGGPPTDL